MNLTELDFRVADFSAMSAIATSLGELTDGFYPTPVSRKISKLWRDFATAVVGLPHCTGSASISNSQNQTRYLTRPYRSVATYWVYSPTVAMQNTQLVTIRTALVADQVGADHEKSHDAMEWMETAEQALAAINKYLAAKVDQDLARRLYILFAELLVDIDALDPANPVGVFISTGLSGLHLSLDIADAPNHHATIGLR